MNWIARAKVAAARKGGSTRAEEPSNSFRYRICATSWRAILSGGQKKLLELGRTMMTDARLVLLDEPGAGVNPTLLLKIRDMISELHRERGYTFCLIEHDMDLISSLCDPVIVLAEGTVLTQGKMEDVRRDPEVLDAYLGGGEDE